MYVWFFKLKNSFLNIWTIRVLNPPTSYVFIRMLSLWLCSGVRSVAFQLFRYLFFLPRSLSLIFSHFCISFIFFLCPFVLPRLYLPTVYLTSFPFHPLVVWLPWRCSCVCLNQLSVSVWLCWLSRCCHPIKCLHCLMGLVKLVICN